MTEKSLFTMSKDEIFSNSIPFLSPDSLLAVNKDGLYRISCPFEVTSLVDFPNIKKGQTRKVSLIKLSKECPILYVIERKFYCYKFFSINEKGKD